MPNENGTSIYKLRRNTTITGHFNATQCLCEPVNIRRSRTRREQALPSFSKSGLKVATAQQEVTLWNCGQLPNLSTTPCHAIGKQLELGSPKRQAWCSLCSLRLFVEVCWSLLKFVVYRSDTLSSCLRPHHWNSANDHWAKILDIDGRWWKGIVEFSRSYESAVFQPQKCPIHHNSLSGTATSIIKVLDLPSIPILSSLKSKLSFDMIKILQHQYSPTNPKHTKIPPDETSNTQWSSKSTDLPWMPPTCHGRSISWSPLDLLLCLVLYSDL